jgi:hypothetical protein
MICPLDQQPCTLDHSNECWNACETTRIQSLRRRRAQLAEWRRTNYEGWAEHVS